MQFIIEVKTKNFHGADFDRVIITGEPTAPIGKKRETELLERAWNEAVENHKAVNGGCIEYFGHWRWEIE